MGTELEKDIERLPAGYWVKRAIIQEEYLERIINVIGGALPHLQADICLIGDQCNKVLGDLDDAYPKPPTTDKEPD